MLVVIISDNYYCLKGSEARLESQGADVMPFYVSPEDTISGDVLCRYLSGLIVSLCVVAVENDPVRYKICAALGRTVSSVCLVLDYPVDLFAQSPGYGVVLPKKAVLDFSLLARKVVRQHFAL